ncbi:FAD binding domain/FAD dependent oxidoreductase, partial [Leishmania naiffi]
MWRRSSARRNVPFPVLRNAEAFPRVDLCIIGGGPGGIAAAMRAIEYGKSVCIVESGRVGGADLWGGTVPSKMMWAIADVVVVVRVASNRPVGLRTATAAGAAL